MIKRIIYNPIPCTLDFFTIKTDELRNAERGELMKTCLTQTATSAFGILIVKGSRIDYLLIPRRIQSLQMMQHVAETRSILRKKFL